jgi:hypothetical protein
MVLFFLSILPDSVKKQDHDRYNYAIKGIYDGKTQL